MSISSSKMAERNIQGTDDESNLRDICGQHPRIAGNRGISFTDKDTMRITAGEAIDKRQYHLSTQAKAFTLAINKYCGNFRLQTEYENETVQITRK